MKQYGNYMGRRVALCASCGGGIFRGRCRVCGAKPTAFKDLNAFVEKGRLSVADAQMVAICRETAIERGAYNRRRGR